MQFYNLTCIVRKYGGGALLSNTSAAHARKTLKQKEKRDGK